MAFDHQISKRRGRPQRFAHERARCGRCDDAAEFVCSYCYYRGRWCYKIERHLCRKHTLIFATSNEIAALPKKAGDIEQPPEVVNAAKRTKSVSVAIKIGKS